MTEKSFCVITFPSTHQALRLESRAARERVAVQIIPVPRQISSSCGLAGRFSCEDQKKIESLCQKNNIQWEEFYRFYTDPSRPPEIIE